MVPLVTIVEKDNSYHCGLVVLPAMTTEDKHKRKLNQKETNSFFTLILQYNES